MDTHDRRKLDYLQDFGFRCARFQSVLNMAAHARPVNQRVMDPPSVRSLISTSSGATPSIHRPKNGVISRGP